MLKRIFGIVSLFLLTVAASSAQTGVTIRVAAAANLQAVLTTKIIPAFEAKTSIVVIPVIGATKTLEQQFENGAGFDVFVSADTATVDKLADENLIDKSSVKPYVLGTLVLWYADTAQVHPTSISDLTDPRITHVAVANPKTAPYGEAAIESIASLKLMDKLTPKLVYAENIGQALQYGESGNADASFTALSLVINLPGGSWVEIPGSLHKPILQSLGVGTNAPAAARLFAEYLTSKDVDKIWKAYGYHLPKH